ncbi:flavin reductase family protein [Streptomyces sp. NPDC026673]|uniref:flavin reductase family protein n=1 Tax=Streptomyces sp. NPDC026673 TaxID=3155724 RepID=UPI003400B03B
MDIDEREFRACLGRFATGVTVVSCHVGEAVHGATVNAFSAVSLRPPLVLVSLDRRSKACRYFDGRPFAVSVLGSGDRDTALHFAGRPQPHLRVDWVEGPVAPRIATGIAAFACTPWATYDGGDHVLYVGEVREITRAADAAPLLFHAGSFHRVGAPADGAPWLQSLDSPEPGPGWWPHRRPERVHGGQDHLAHCA